MLFDSQYLSPEMRLVLNAIQVRAKNQKSDPGNLSKGADWTLVTRLGIQHGVLPLVYKYLKNQQKIFVPQSVLKELKDIYLTNVAQNLVRTKKLLAILGILSDQGCLAVPFKGPVIAAQAFGDIGLRAFADLDILIREEDFYRVYELMESNGYKPGKPMIGEMKFIWKRTGRNFEFSGKNCMIDFHQQVSQGPGFLRMKNKWDSLSSVELLSQQVPVLNVYDTIMMLVLHGTHHGWNTLKLVADLSHLVYSYATDIDWGLLQDKARKMGAWRMVMIGIMLGQQLCGLDIPSGVEDWIQTDQKSEKLACYFYGKTMEPEKSAWVPATAIPRSLDSGYYKMLHWLYYIFNPTNLDILAVKLPKILYPLYYLVRPVRLFLNLIGDGVTGLKKKLS